MLFLLSKWQTRPWLGEYKAWHSEDGGKTVKEYTDHNTGVYFVSIDHKGWMYTATQAGAFVTEDKGATWFPLHVMISSNTNCREKAGPCEPSEPNCGGQCDRVPHDYQNIVPDFRGDGIAFPSDQGLHVLDRLSPTSPTNSSSNHTLISVIGASLFPRASRSFLLSGGFVWELCGRARENEVLSSGDMHNSMALSAIIAPSKVCSSRIALLIKTSSPVITSVIF